MAVMKNATTFLYHPSLGICKRSIDRLRNVRPIFRAMLFEKKSVSSVALARGYRTHTSSPVAASISMSPNPLNPSEIPSDAASDVASDAPSDKFSAILHPDPHRLCNCLRQFLIVSATFIRHRISGIRLCTNSPLKVGLTGLLCKDQYR